MLNLEHNYTCIVVIDDKEEQDEIEVVYKEKKRDTIVSSNGKIKVNKLQKKKYYFRDNLYVVFAGGDDCFIIGAWDALIEFAVILQREFNKYQTQFLKEFPILKGPITISAGFILVDSHFPVIKFAQQVEDELHKAKQSIIDVNQTDASGKILKNKISFLGEVFSWEGFGDVIKVKNRMESMIKEYREGKAFLQRIIDSFENTDTEYWKNNNKPFDPALIWRFLYQFRDIRTQKYFKAEFYEYFFGDINYNSLGGAYKKYLLDVFDNQGQPNTFPVAARWTDFLTRKK